jgi:bacteriocin-like protein
MEKTMSKNWMHNFKPSVEVRELREELSEEDLEKVSGGYIGETEKNVSCEKLSIDGWHRVAVMK